MAVAAGVVAAAAIVVGHQPLQPSACPLRARALVALSVYGVVVATAAPTAAAAAAAIAAVAAAAAALG